MSVLKENRFDQPVIDKSARAPATGKDSGAGVDHALQRGIERLVGDQQADGHWIYELEADCTIPAEYICYLHYMDERDPELESRLAEFLLSEQMNDGSWPLFHGGQGDLSCTVKAYFGLKLSGVDADAEPMQRARRWILDHGGAERTNVFTRILLAWFEQVPWTAVPYIPAEIMLLPRWFFFSLARVSYWSRTVMVPLFILYSLRARAANPTGTDIRECFVEAPEAVRNWFPVRSRLNRLFLWLEAFGRRTEWMIPGVLHRYSLKRAERWFIERLNGLDGLGAIFPAMVNASIALKELGYTYDHPFRDQAREALRSLIVEHPGRTYVQPCVSPIWDTGLAALALDASQEPEAVQAAERGLDWLVDRQITDAPGDWRRGCPDLPGGGWAFQYRNDHYPDLDDTAMVAWAMHYHDPERYRPVIERAAFWLAGMQSSNGGFGAFDIDNDSEYLNHIPFADHGALLDPPTADVSARCLTLFALLDDPRFERHRQRARQYLLAEQEPGGCWFGRWGTNYIYGTWSALVALGVDGVERNQEAITRAVAWLEARQHADGGWGEGNQTYHDPELAGTGSCSRAFQTGWAMLGLIAVGRGDSPSVWRGAEYLACTQSDDGYWPDPWFTAPGFPRVFYLKYHGYSRYFPLWALAAARRAWQQPG